MKNSAKCTAAWLMALLIVISGFSVAVTAEEEARLEILGGRDAVRLTLTETVDTFYAYEILPVDDYETVTWTVADETVLRLDTSTDLLRPVAPGVTTVTATTDTGLSDTVTVTVVEPTVWHDGDVKQLIYRRDGEVQTYVYVPKATGDYTIYSEGEGDPFVEVYNSKLKLIKKVDDNRDFNFIAQVSLTAGETYYITVGAYEPTITTVTLKPGIDTSFTSFAFVQEHVTLRVGDTFYPLFHYEPISTLFNGCDIVTADDSVAVSTGFGVEAQGVGTTTLTATAEDGSVATMTVSVEDPVVLKAGGTVDVGFSNGVMMRSYTVTVDETATYAIQSFDASTVQAVLFDADGNSLKKTDAKGNSFLIKWELIAGVSYTLCVLAPDPFLETTFEVGLAKVDTALKPTAIKVVFDKTILMKQQDNEVWLKKDSQLSPTVVHSGAYGTMAESYSVAIADDGVLVEHLFGGWVCAAVGDTTLTVTTKSGVTCTYIVHVIEDLYGDFDLDGVVDIADATHVFRYTNGRMLLSDGVVALYDVTGDNCVDITDAVTMFRFVNGRIDTLY